MWIPDCPQGGWSTTGWLMFTTTFGYSGTYWDYTQEIAKERGGLKGLINLNVANDDVASILKESGFKGYRFEGALTWISKTLKMIRELD